MKKPHQAKPKQTANFSKDNYDKMSEDILKGEKMLSEILGGFPGFPGVSGSFPGVSGFQ